MAALAVWWRVLTGGSLNPLAGLDLGPDAMLGREELIGEEILEVLREAEAEAGRVAPHPARGTPACWPAARPHRARWPIGARAGRFIPIDRGTPWGFPGFLRR